MSDQFQGRGRPPPDSKGVMCNNCFRFMGPGTSTPSRRCGKCRSASYCSQECAVANWKEHLPMCRFLRKISGLAEENALMNPRGPAMRQALAAYAEEINDEVRELAVRSAFRVTQPNHLCDTVLLQLCFEWDDRPTNIRQQFTLLATGTPSFQEVINSKEEPICDLLPSMLEARKQASKPPHAKQMIVLFFAKHHITEMHADILMPSFTYSMPPFINPVPPYLEQKFIADWPGVLAMSLARPFKPTDAVLLADNIVASEGLGTAIRIMVGSGMTVEAAQKSATEAQKRLATVPSFEVLQFRLAH